MSESESTGDLDPRVAAALGELREALDEGIEENRRRLEETAAHFEERLREAGAATAPGPLREDGGALTELLAAAGEIDRATSQAALLGALLEGVASFASRTLLLVTRAGGLEGWAGFGFEDAAGRVDELRLEVGSGTVWDRFLREREVVELSVAECAAVCSALQTTTPAEGLLVPMVLRQQVAGGVYADHPGGGEGIDREAIALLVWAATNALETLPLRHPPREAESPAEDREEAAAEPPADEPVEETLPREGRVEEAPVAVEEPRREEGERDLRPPEAPEETEPRTVAPLQPPVDHEGPGWAFTETAAEEDVSDPRHGDARRLARLLVTEIKLYNEEKVEESRERGNLYEALREDIERSRQIFEQRVDEQIRAESDYFQEELVRILARGDAAALGI